ncbi:MAG: ABC transporter permease [Bacteroidales bacterium]|nr:ABC transporter permease [Bacteroidales bacterium]
MRGLLLIIGRELRMKLRRPSFWVLTLLVPVALAVLYALPVIAAQRTTEPQTVLVVDETGLFEGGLRSTTDVHFHSMPSLKYAADHNADDEDLVLYIPLKESVMPREATLYYYGKKAPSLAVQSTIDNQLQMLLRNAIMEDVYGLSLAERHSVESSHISLRTRDVVTGREGQTRVKSVLSTVLAVLMTLALIIFGVQAMRAVQEERQNRVAEVIVSSVKPVQLMGGKLGGVALTALLQLALWCALTAAAVAGIQAAAPDLFDAAREQAAQRSLASKGDLATLQYDTPVTLVDDTVTALTSINLPLIAAMFMLFFLLGFLLYGSLLAALAARLDGDAAALQWTLLISLPLIVACGQWLVVSGSQWLVLLPFTAPAAIVAALPFGISTATAIWSALLLSIFGAAALWLAARTYKRHII